jgi:hypothetical protein
MFLPEHLVGRGITLLNFMFIAGAAVMQAGSGVFIDFWRKSGASGSTTFAALHWSFAAILMICALIYLAAPARPKA